MRFIRQFRERIIIFGLGLALHLAPPLYGANIVTRICGLVHGILSLISPPQRGEYEHVLKLVSRLPGFEILGNVSVSPLLGGLTNQGYRVESPAGVLFVRAGVLNPERFGIVRANEKTNALLAAERNIGPKVLFFDDKTGDLVTEFVSGPWIPGSGKSMESSIVEVAFLLRALHNGPPFQGKINVRERVIADSVAAKRYGVLPTGHDVLMKKVEEAEELLSRLAVLCPTHQDIHPGNILRDAKGDLKLIDWEYSGQGDPYSDLAQISLGLGLESSGKKLLIEKYQGSTSPKDLARLLVWEALLQVRFGVWSYHQWGATGNASQYQARAQYLYAEGKRKFNSPEFSEALLALRRP